MKREINVTLTDVTGKSFEFDTLHKLQNFCKQELKFWTDTNNSLPENITLSREFTKANYLQKISNTFESWKESEPDWDEAAFNSQFQQLRQQQIIQLSGDWLWHGHSFIPIWIELHEKSQETTNSFLTTVLKRPPNNIGSSVDNLIGHIIGYEFLMQDESELTKRRSSEKRSLSQLRDQLSVKNNELIERIDNFIEQTEKWADAKKENIEKLYKVREKLAQRQIINQARKFNRDLTARNEKFNNLEKTYQEVLRLKKPAEYWEKAASKYGKQGVLFSLIIVLFVVIGLRYFEGFFIAWLQGQELDISLNSLQGVVIFGSIVAIYAFLIRIFSRLAFSSFHLMRDAEEREQLTYLYLSLAEETSVEDESRNIILQALFSRTETGLLAQEHGPTMPGVSEALKFAGKAR